MERQLGPVPQRFHGAVHHRYVQRGESSLGPCLQMHRAPEALFVRARRILPRSPVWLRLMCAGPDGCSLTRDSCTQWSKHTRGDKAAFRRWVRDTILAVFSRTHILAPAEAGARGDSSRLTSLSSPLVSEEANAAGACTLRRRPSQHRAMRRGRSVRHRRRARPHGVLDEFRR